MKFPEITEYFKNSRDRKTREDLIFAASQIQKESVVIDCGCGSGADISYLRNCGFVVYAFDIEIEAISICEERFAGDDKVFLFQDSFTSFKYPNASLVNADASLFFCGMNQFDSVWANISDALIPNGIFCGSFLGLDDGMAGGDIDKGAYWPNVTVFQEQDLRARFTSFNVLRFTEHRVSGKLPNGHSTFWHIYSVVAQQI